MGSWINAVFAWVIILRVAPTIARMEGRASPVAGIAVLGLLLGAVGWAAVPFYSGWESYTDTLLIGSVALYLVADRSCLTCVAMPPWPRLRFAGLAAAVVVATLWVGHAHTAPIAAAEEPDVVTVSRAELERLVAHTNARD